MKNVPATTRFLIFEDSAIQAKKLTGVLKALGYNEVRCSGNPFDAVATIQNYRAQLILCDWNMPVKSGIDVLHEVNLVDTLKKIPFVFITANADNTHVMHAMKNGASDYIVKPTTPDVLQTKFASLKFAK